MIHHLTVLRMNLQVSKTQNIMTFTAVRGDKEIFQFRLGK
jgi:hypothetical protein